MRTLVVCAMAQKFVAGRARWFSDSCQGLFQITVKLPHEPYKIQVMVGGLPKPIVMEQVL
jgi:hypothetical protein